MERGTDIPLTASGRLWGPLSRRGGLALFFLFVFLAYANTFQSPWILDDFHNIVFNPTLRIEKEGGLRQALVSFFAGGRLDRPIARLSFALNRAAGADNPWGYHLVNTLIHAIAAYLLYRVIALLLRTRAAGDGGDVDEAAALFAALLWALHPIQTQAVTYIVQRMTALAGLFSLLGVYCFLRARGGGADGISRPGWWGGCLLSFLLAIASKENAVLFPAGLLLIEVLFFRGGEWKALLWRRNALLPWAGGLLVSAAAFYFLTAGDLQALLNYEERYFTLTERLLTQPRVLWLYLGLIAWPMPWRFSLEHDVPISTSFFEPWTTAPALVGIFLLVTLGWKARKRFPFLSFGILFYFLNHLVESTVLPLEMAFEHRNYIPSMFLFVAPALGILGAGRVLTQRDPSFRRWVFAVPLVLVVALGGATFVRNLAWASPAALWSDTLQKAPRSGRAMAYLALICSESPSGLPLALRLYEKALAAEHPNRRLAAEILNNMAALRYAAGEYAAAAATWGQALERYPGYPEARYRLALALFRDGQSRKALEHLDSLLERDAQNPYALNLRGKIRFETGDPAGALEDWARALAAAPDYAAARLNVGALHASSGDGAKAKFFLSPLRDHPDFGFAARLWLLVAIKQPPAGAGEAGPDGSLFPGMRLEEAASRLAELQREPRIADAVILPVFDEPLRRMFASPQRMGEERGGRWTLAR